MSDGGEDFDFKAAVDKMLLVSDVLSGLRLDLIVETVERAHTIGPFVDPTAYRDALYRGDMDWISELAGSLQGPQRVYRDRILPKLKEA